MFNKMKGWIVRTAHNELLPVVFLLLVVIAVMGMAINSDYAVVDSQGRAAKYVDYRGIVEYGQCVPLELPELIAYQYANWDPSVCRWQVYFMEEGK